MVYSKANKSGFTFLEMIIAISIFIVVSALLSILFFNYYRTYHFQQGLVNVAGSASTAANELQVAVLQADHIVSSHDFSGTVYDSDQHTLVLRIPSVNSSGNVVSGYYDYVVFYTAGNLLYKLVQADAVSSRISGQKQLSGALSSINFTYNNTNLDQATKVNVEIQVQTTVGGQIIPYHLQQEMYLRNFKNE